MLQGGRCVSGVSLFCSMVYYGWVIWGIRREYGYVSGGFVKRHVDRLHLGGGMSRCRVDLSLNGGGDCVRSLASKHSLPAVRDFLSVYSCLRIAPRRFFSSRLRGLPLVSGTASLVGRLSSRSVLTLVSVLGHLTLGHG